MNTDKTPTQTPAGHDVTLMTGTISNERAAEPPYIEGWCAQAERVDPETGWTHTVSGSGETEAEALADFDVEWQRFTDRWAHLAEQARIPLTLLPPPPMERG